MIEVFGVTYKMLMKHDSPYVVVVFTQRAKLLLKSYHIQLAINVAALAYKNLLQLVQSALSPLDNKQHMIAMII